MSEIQPDDTGRAIDVCVTKLEAGPDYVYRVESNASVLPHAEIFPTSKLALKAATELGRRYSNGAVIRVVSADGELIWSEVYRPPRALWQPLQRAFVSYLQVAVFVVTLIGTGIYFWCCGEVYDKKSGHLVEPLPTVIGYTVVAISILASLGAAATLRVALDHSKRWTLRREVIARSVSLVVIAIVTFPAAVIAYFVTDETILKGLIVALSGLLALFIFGIVRILTSVYCYASDVREVD